MLPTSLPVKSFSELLPVPLLGFLDIPEAQEDFVLFIQVVPRQWLLLFRCRPRSLATFDFGSRRMMLALDPR